LEGRNRKAIAVEAKPVVVRLGLYTASHIIERLSLDWVITSQLFGVCMSVARKSPEELLNEWLGKATEVQKAHFQEAIRLGRLRIILGIPVVVLTALIGTSVFVGMKEDVGLWAHIGVGLLSVGASVLATLQTFLGYAEQSEKHRVAGAQYGNLRRDIEAFLARPDDKRGDSLAFLDQVKDRLNKLALESPPLPSRLQMTAAA